MKALRQKLVGGLVQPLSVLEWKWEIVFVNFILGLLRTIKGHTMILVIIERVTKPTSFILKKSMYSVSK